MEKGDTMSTMNMKTVPTFASYLYQFWKYEILKSKLKIIYMHQETLILNFEDLLSPKLV